ncbi:larval cuticle protein A2B-like [Orussus abietinus]|uniref:larval cuticle protein A2B-like n=1 Tax=Orussus abietinus TaxID=222816 RepID=UPI0006250459|nr:larval cuticle protein A2B-like [Orussus abietinus]
MALAAAARAAILSPPVALPAVTVGKDGETFDPHPQYSYGYDVQDALTGDSKTQHETRDGDLVRGTYSFVEADGTRRVVDYTADSLNGFNAVVRKEPVLVDAAVVAPAPVAAAATVTSEHAEVKVAHAPVAVHGLHSWAPLPAVALAHAPVAFAGPLAFARTHFGYGLVRTPFGLAYH